MAEVDIQLALAILGSILAAFGPLLPWWKTSTRQMGIQASTVTGTEVWPGVVAFVGGIVALSACTYAYTRPDRRGILGLVIVGAGATAFLGSVLAVSNSEHLVDTILRVSSQIGLVVSLAGGFIAATGGYLLTREGSGT